ncbi:hypothetical protein ANMWB30_40790 [Arthrobacter sp. MWB30]|nr:hypothetical protein ANMWB30_40790 [Arthrobacter sp. MWB30]
MLKSSGSTAFAAGTGTVEAKIAARVAAAAATARRGEVMTPNAEPTLLP